MIGSPEVFPFLVDFGVQKCFDLHDHDIFGEGSLFLIGIIYVSGGLALPTLMARLLIGMF